MEIVLIFPLRKISQKSFMHLLKLTCCVFYKSQMISPYNLNYVSETEMRLNWYSCWSFCENMPSNLTCISFSRDLSDISKWDLKSASKKSQISLWAQAFLIHSLERIIWAAVHIHFRDLYFTWSLCFCFYFSKLILKRNIWDEVDTW